MNKQKIFLNISEIASFIGQNKWDYITPFERLWKRCDKETYEICLKETKLKLNKNKEELSVMCNEKTTLKKNLDQNKITKIQYHTQCNVLEKKEETLQKKINNSIDVVEKACTTEKERINNKLGNDVITMINDISLTPQSKKDDIIKCIEDLQMSETKKKDLIKETKSYINKTHGVLKEDSAIKLFEEKYKVKLNTDQVYNTLFLEDFYEKSDYLWYIGGKVDGLHKDYVVEVKNRTKGFFNTTREYENTQIQLYMHLLDINMSKLVEKYNNKIKITVIYKCDDTVNDILEYLKIFSKEFENFIKGEMSEKIKFINGTEKEKQTFLKLLYLDKINKRYHEKHFVEIEKNDNVCLIDDLD